VGLLTFFEQSSEVTLFFPEPLGGAGELLLQGSLGAQAVSGQAVSGQSISRQVIKAKGAGTELGRQAHGSTSWSGGAPH